MTDTEFSPSKYVKASGWKGLSNVEIAEKLRTLGLEAPEVMKTIVDTDVFVELPAYRQSHLYANKWYRNIPATTSAGFPSFLIASRELVSWLTGSREYTIYLVKEATAYIDQEKKRIFLPSYVIHLHPRIKEEWTGLEKDLGPAIVSLVNGNLLHEAAHSVKSPNTIAEVTRKIPPLQSRALSKAGYGKDAIMPAIANLVEDVYIEDWLRKAYPAYTPFLECTHEFYFNEYEAAARICSCFLNAIIDPESGPSLQIEPFIDLLILAAKNWRFGLEVWGSIVSEYVELFLEARGADQLDQRRDVIDKICRKMEEDLDVTKRLHPSFSSSVLHDCMLDLSPDKLMDKGGQSVTIFFEKADKLARNEMYDGDGKDKEELTLSLKEGVELAETITAALEAMNLEIQIKTKQNEIGTVPSPLVIHLPKHSMVIFDPDPRFSKLGQGLRYMFTHNYAPGEPRRKGTKLVPTRLYRIATDQKIFTYREKKKAIGKDFEIIILMDCSGSMITSQKIEKCVRAGFSAWKSLRQARVRAHLLGHSTADHMGSPGERPAVYVFGGPHSSFKDVARRCSIILHDNKYLRNNYDGFALLKAAEFFSSNAKKKWLIHISDGAPMAVRYCGPKANLHTRNSAMKLRQSGIDVVSLTIDTGAWEVNDKIYGKEKNVKTTSPRVLYDLLQAMFHILPTKKNGGHNGS